MQRKILLVYLFGGEGQCEYENFIKGQGVPVTPDVVAVFDNNCDSLDNFNKMHNTQANLIVMIRGLLNFIKKHNDYEVIGVAMNPQIQGNIPSGWYHYLDQCLSFMSKIYYASYMVPDTSYRVISIEEFKILMDVPPAEID